MAKANQGGTKTTIPRAHFRLAQRGEDPVMVLSSDPWERESIYGKAPRQGPAPGAGKVGFDSNDKSVKGERQSMTSSALLGQEHIDYLVWALDGFCKGRPFLPALDVSPGDLEPCDPVALAQLFEESGLRTALLKDGASAKSEERYAVAATEVWRYGELEREGESARKVVPLASVLAALADARMATEGLMCAIGQRMSTDLMEGLLASSSDTIGSMYTENPWSLRSYRDFLEASDDALPCLFRVIDHYNRRHPPHSTPAAERSVGYWDASDEDYDRLAADLFGAFSGGVYTAIGEVRYAGRDELKKAVELVTRSKFGLSLWYRHLMESFGVGHVKECLTCGNIFITSRSHANYCTDSCRVGASKKRHSG